VGAALLIIDPVSAAHRLLGAILTGRGVRAVVVEVEAYGGMPDGPWPDTAAHSYRGITSRNAVTFGPPGRLYTYRSHGIHVCANVSCGPDGTAAAVLLRAAAVRDGDNVARSRRGATMAQPCFGARSGKSVLRFGDYHGRQRNRFIRRKQPRDAEACRYSGCHVGSAGRGQSGRRPEVAVMACGAPRSLRL
jgi:hypothetical protein